MPLRDKVRDLALALRDGGESRFADHAEAAAAGNEEQLLAFLTSNDLWGGAGSIADQAAGGGERTPQRRKIEAILVALGHEQLRNGNANVRTKMWISAFGEWERRGI
jgi:hypothetical protein